jgi:Hydrogen maturase F tetramerization domain
VIKREKAFQTIAICDVTLIVADPFKTEQSAECVVDILKEVHKAQNKNRLVEEQEVNGPLGSVASSSTSTKTTSGSIPTPLPLLVFNLRGNQMKQIGDKIGASIETLLDEFEKKVVDRLTSDKPDNMNVNINRPSLPPSLAVDLTASKVSRDRVIGFIERYADPRPKSVSVLPEWLTQDTHTQGNSTAVFLNIPMDKQTPGMRLLRPQAMVQEALIRNFVGTFCYRMDLGMARSDDPKEKETEKHRFLQALSPWLKSGEMPLLITDSQAIDIVAPWTVDEAGNEIVPITTFSIAMIRYLSGGRLNFFVDGLRQLDQMIARTIYPQDDKWRILIVEACNHTRLNMEKQCADIGTVQLPNHLREVLGAENVEFEFMFGKHLVGDWSKYDLVVHCGGCMLTHQQTQQRVADLITCGVPATNYGLLLSRIQSRRTLSRVLKPWGIKYDHEEETAHRDPLMV